MAIKKCNCPADPIHNPGAFDQERRYGKGMKLHTEGMQNFTCCCCGNTTAKSKSESNKEWQGSRKSGVPDKGEKTSDDKSTKPDKKSKPKKIEKKQRGRGG